MVFPGCGFGVRFVWFGVVVFFSSSDGRGSCSTGCSAVLGLTEKGQRDGAFIRERVSSLPLPFQSVGSVYSGLMQGVGAAEKVFEFIDRKPTMVNDGSLAPDHVDGKVEFRNVTFSYRTRSATQVLQVSPNSAKSSPSGGYSYHDIPLSRQ